VCIQISDVLLSKISKTAETTTTTSLQKTIEKCENKETLTQQ
jgi:hypothetical protein